MCYKYVKGIFKIFVGESRIFCKMMLKKKMLYCKEDIGMMSVRGVNKKFGYKGRNYFLFKYKGGVNCYYRWECRIYKKWLKKDGIEWGGNVLQGIKFVNVN